MLCYRTDDHKPSALALALAFAGAGISFVSGWSGGELIERLGVGVDSAAHVDASSSVAAEPGLTQASEQRAGHDGVNLQCEGPVWRAPAAGVPVFSPPSTEPAAQARLP